MNTDNQGGISIRSIVKLAIGAFVLIALAVSAYELTGSNNTANWQVLQTPGGSVSVIDTAGYYNTWFGRVWTYPRVEQVEYDKNDSFKVTFNDGGLGTMNALVRYQLPTTKEGKLALHNQFNGNTTNIEAAVWAHLNNAMRSTAPIMSASEHQSARQSEFNQLVYDQLNKGLYETRKISIEQKDQTDSNGKPITVYATEIVTDKNGQPHIANPSPLAQLGITVIQFSITHIDYDDATKTQFATKKAAFLAAENSKAQREKEVQERLMVEERGRREKAENEAQANKEKATAVIQAQKEKEVAELRANQEKIVAETNAAKLVAVALQTKAEAETRAAQDKSVAETAAARDFAVAKLQRQAAEEQAAKQVALAKAQEESLKVAGAISERERVLAEIEREKAIGVARELSKIAVPTTVISNGASANSQGSASTAMDNLISITLMEKLNALPKKN